jgi:hypothetical protein
MTPQLEIDTHIPREESVKLEESPRTPPMSRASMRFLDASQRTPPPTQQPEPRSTPTHIEQLQPFVFEPQYVTTIRSYDDREQLLDPNMFTPVFFRLIVLMYRGLWRHGHFRILLGKGRRIFLGWEGAFGCFCRCMVWRGHGASSDRLKP